MFNEEDREGFEYSEKFDRHFLLELYSGDTLTAEEIFGSSISQVRMELTLIESLAVRGDVEGLRRAFHKIKPLFGYTGLLSVQDYVQEFETRCQGSVLMTDLQVAYENIMEIVRDAIEGISREHQKLMEFNNRRA
jgi:HPt (histidine-containing phosphotransfer) domain-containing protein